MRLRFKNRHWPASSLKHARYLNPFSGRLAAPCCCNCNNKADYCLIFGLASGGSGFWNSALDTPTTEKTKMGS